MFSTGALALDLATNTGWAFVRKPEDHEKPIFGSLRFAPRGSSRPKVYHAMIDWLEEMLKSEPKIGLIVFESAAVPSAMMGHTTIDVLKMLMGMGELLEYFCHDRIELREANVSQVRQHFLGTTRMKRDQAKAATIEKCRTRGWDVKNDDEADACALLQYQICCLRPDIAATLTPLYQRRLDF